MNDGSLRSNVVSRRGDLLAELFLQDLGATFIARPTTDLGYDLLVGFENPEGGVSFAAVEVKATDRPVAARLPVRLRQYRRLANANVPGLLLVADVKQNRLFYAIPSLDPLITADAESEIVPVPLREIDERAREELRAQLSRSQFPSEVVR